MRSGAYFKYHCNLKKGGLGKREKVQIKQIYKNLSLMNPEDGMGIRGFTILSSLLRYLFENSQKKMF